VEQVSWEEAAEFCARLSQATGRAYRLPREAEWEYAARARTTTPFHFGETIITELVNFAAWGAWGSTPRGTARERTTPVGSEGSANAFGLYAMHGNVWEWCQDWYDEKYYQHSPKIDPPGPATGSLRVQRGGSWHAPAANCRSAVRSFNSPSYRDAYLGLRVVRAAK
jgi:formylglycine-generating enzyme required for sulfatase activity